MKEQQYQNNIIKKLEKDGYYVIKLIKTNKNGIPDLLALKKGFDPLFIECKCVNGKLSKLQEFRINELSKKGFEVGVSYGNKITEIEIDFNNNGDDVPF